jgi:uncharacterized membrane protein YheB (UPF0754 family)
MGRWLMMLLVSLLSAVPVLRRLRRRGREGAAAGDGTRGILPAGESAKVASIWSGFGERVAAVVAVPAVVRPPPPADVREPEREKRAIFIVLARLSPWVLLGMAAASALFEAGSRPRALLLLGGLSGFIGFGTNWLAIRLLFKPTRPRFGFGVIPANRAALVRRLAAAIEKHLVNPDVLSAWLHEKGIVKDLVRGWHEGFSRVLQSAELREDLKQRIAASGRLYLADEGFRSSLSEKLAQVAREIFREKLWKWVIDLVEKPVLDRLKAELNSGLEKHGDQLLDNTIDKLDGWLDGAAAVLTESLPDLEQIVSEQIVAGLRRLDIRALVETQLGELDEGELERLIHEATRNELAAVEVLGGVLGVLAGLLMPLFL